MKDLRTEDEIIANWKDNIDKPVVSICCITYNHEKYIEDAIKGFLIQETDFPFEILIHDDASTDRTADIIRQYEAKYPRLIKPIYQTENQYSQGIKISATYNFPRAKGDYIAFCEGDDYWIDKDKLQKQYDFLKLNQEYSLCFHSAKIINEQDNFYFRGESIANREYSGQEILAEWTIPTASVMFVNNEAIKNILIINLHNKSYMYGDIIIFLTLVEFGKLRGLKDVMSVYRRHPGGITKKHVGVLKLKEFIKHHEEISSNFNGAYISTEKKILSRLYFALAIHQILKVDIRFMISLLKSLNKNPLVFIKSFKYYLVRLF